VFDALFRFFFELSPVVFSQGEFRFAASTGSYVAAVVVLAAVGLTLAAYRSGRGRARDRVALAAIRIALLALILVCLFRPLLVVKAGSTRIAVAKNAIRRLHAARAHIVGGLLTHHVPEHAGKGYDYGGYSYYSYGGPGTKLCWMLLTLVAPTSMTATVPNCGDSTSVTTRLFSTR